jgi:hypothetical protein
MTSPRERIEFVSQESTVFLAGFKEMVIISTGFRKSPQYQISLKSVK